jgi:4-hydroxybenzoate polyprenyltransferase
VKALSLAFRELVLGGHLLALGTASIAGAAAFLLGRSPTVVLLLMAYLFSFGAYMMNRSAEMDQDLLSHPDRTNYLAQRKRVLPGVVAASFIVGYVLAATVSVVFLLALLAPLGLSLLYSVGSKRLVGLIGAKTLKQKVLLKNVSISFGWSLIPVLVGLYFGAFNLALLLLSPFIFFRLMTNTIIFDIRDADGDRENGVKTLPTELGVSKSFKVVAAVDALSALYLVMLLIVGLVPTFAVTLIILPIYSTAYRGFAMRSNANLGFICDVIADAEYLLWGPLIYLGKIFI